VAWIITLATAASYLLGLVYLNVVLGETPNPTSPTELGLSFQDYVVVAGVLLLSVAVPLVGGIATRLYAAESKLGGALLTIVALVALAVLGVATNWRFGAACTGWFLAGWIVARVANPWLRVALGVFGVIFWLLLLVGQPAGQIDQKDGSVTFATIPLNLVMRPHEVTIFPVPAIPEMVSDLTHGKCALYMGEHDGAYVVGGTARTWYLPVSSTSLMSGCP
jgi:hypothetical protein